MMPSTFEHLTRLFHPIWQLVTAILLSTIPLWWAVARRPIDPLLKLLLATLANFIFVYFLEFGAYLLSLPQWVPLSLLMISFVYSVVVLFKSRFEFPWNGLLAWIALSIWILGLQGWIAAYGAASWYGDWYEHYERSIWFLEQQSSQQKFLFGMWPLSARGPLFNSICAMLMNSGDDFASFQVFATVLNTFPVLPVALLIRYIAKFKVSSALIWSVLICGLAPFAVQQETYTWTKIFTAGILLSGIYLYRIGLSENNTIYVALSFGAFATALLAHYLSTPFTFFFILHFLVTFVKRKWKPRLIITILLGCSLLVFTWFAYLILEFGIRETVTSNSTLSPDYRSRQQGTEGEIPSWSLVFTGNMVTTTIPYSWREGWGNTWHGIGIARRLKQRDIRMGEQFYPQDGELDLQAEWFAHLVTYPNSLLGGIGYAGMIGLILVVLLRTTRRIRVVQADARPRSDALFWVLFFLCIIPLNVFVERGYSAIGIAHLNMQPFFFLTGVFLLRELHDLRIIRVLLLAIFLAESALITGAWISLQERRLPIIVRENGQIVVRDKVHADAKYVSNYIYKLQVKAVYLSDKLGKLNLPFFFITTALAVGTCVRIGQKSEEPNDRR